MSLGVPDPLPGDACLAVRVGRVVDLSAIVDCPRARVHGSLHDLSTMGVAGGGVQPLDNLERIDDNEDELVKALAAHAVDVGKYAWDSL